MFGKLIRIRIILKQDTPEFLFILVKMSTKATKKRLDSVDLPAGILDRRSLPDEHFDRTWNSIYLAGEEKDQLLNQAVVILTLRTRGVGREVMPVHGVILLIGPPGTGKTSLARGLGSQVAKLIKSRGITYLEVEPHSLTSSAMGKTQRLSLSFSARRYPSMPKPGQ
jgi:SpoVK/Ycf46/Vps4 family AAA+-type ATPase